MPFLVTFSESCKGLNENAEYIRKGMFDWTEDEETNFYKSNIERIAKN